jgi:hypothetical protein
VARAEAAAIDGLTGDRLLRLHVVGDARTNAAARVLPEAARRYALRGDSPRRGRKVWTYTNAWRTVGRESWGDAVSVLASVETPEKPRKPVAFSKGEARINRKGRPRAGQAADQECGGRPRRLLRHMRQVYAREERKDRTEGQKTLRELLRESPKEFIAQLARLEEAEARRQPSRRAAGPGEAERLEMDDGPAWVAGLLEEE